MMAHIGFLIVIFPIFALVVGTLAMFKNRSFIGWFLLSFLITPLFALAALMIVPILMPRGGDAFE